MAKIGGKGRDARGLRRVSLCDVGKRYGMAEGTVDLCGDVAEFL